MTADFKASDPDEIEFTLTTTMTLAAWKKLAAAIQPVHSWPQCDLLSAIRSMVIQAETTYRPPAAATPGL